MEIEKGYYSRISYAKENHGYGVIGRVQVYYMDENHHEIVVGGKPYLLSRYMGSNIEFAIATKDELVQRVTIYPQPKAIYPEDIDGRVWVNAEYSKEIVEPSELGYSIWKRKFYFALPEHKETSENNAISDDTEGIKIKTKHSSKKKAKKGFSKTDKIIVFCIIVSFLILAICAGLSKSKKESQHERTYQTESVVELERIAESESIEIIEEQITKQLDQLLEIINALPEPNEINAARCGDKIKLLQWETIDIPEDAPNVKKLKRSQRHAIEKFVKAKNNYIKKIEKYDGYAGVYYDEVEGYLLDEE